MSTLVRRTGDCAVAAEASLYFALSELVMALPPRVFLLPAVRTAMKSAGMAGNVREARRIHRIVEALTRLWPFRTLCLQRALILVWLLQRRGIKPSLRIGVRKVDGELLAHAWVELDGQPLGDSAEHCASFMRLEGAVETLFRSRQKQAAR